MTRRPIALLAAASIFAACGTSDGTTEPSALPDVDTPIAEPTSPVDEPTPSTTDTITIPDDPTVVVTTTEQVVTTTEPAGETPRATTPEGAEIVPVPAPPPDPGAGPVPLCEDLAEVTTDLVGDGTRIDEAFVRLVSQYGADNSDVYGGLWFDREAGGVAVIGFTEDPESHRAAIEALTVDDLADAESARQVSPEGPLGERDFPWDLVRVEYTDALLSGLVTTIFEQGRMSPVDVVGGGSRLPIQRVALDLAEPTAEALVELAEFVDSKIVCVNGPLLDPDRTVYEPGDDIDVILRPGGEEFAVGLRAGCAADVTYPIENVLDPVYLVDAGRDDLVEGIERTTETGIEEPGRLAASDTWVLLEETDDTALVYSPAGFAIRQLELQRTAAGWVFQTSSSGGGDCELLVQLPDGLGGVEWVVDPEVPADPSSSTVTVLATEQACTGASAMDERLLGPQVVETDTEVLISFAVIPLTGLQPCPGNPSTAVTIELDRPLGDRVLREGRSTGLTLDELVTR